MKLFSKLLCAALLITVSACSGSESKTNAGSKAGNTGSAAFDRKAALEAAPNTAGVHLIDAGQGEKKLARYSLQSMVESKAVMRMRMDMAMKIDGQPIPAPKTPVSVMPMKMSHKELKDGWLSVSAAYEPILFEETEGVPAEMIAAMKTAFEAFQSVSLNWEIDSRGSIKNMEYAISKPIPPQIKQVLDQTKQSFSNFFVVLPEEPIATGAKWVVVMKDFVVGGVNQEVRMLSEVKDFSDNKISLDVMVLSIVKEQELKGVQGLPPEIKAKVMAAKNYSEGTMKIDLDELAPASKIGGKAKSVMEMTGGPLGEKTQKIETTVNLLMQFGPQ